ncbi:N2,N2-dimethylguanosine tRNA methyltransferase [Cyanobium sp. HWJ4-Hawea]|nr:N2,N2-dimethylguanosine tRNA methyltransferase [Cyanobium sp. HWJ4-Hawea]
MVSLQLGAGFFRPQSRPSRDLGVLLARTLAAQGPVRVLDLMAGCGIRALRYGVEGGAGEVWANDADPDRLPLLQANLAPLAAGKSTLRLRTTARTAQQLLADCLQRQERFELVDLDAFGCPTALLPLALEAVQFGGAIYLASTDGRSPTGHDRPAAIRLLGAAARAHPASWELALRLQIGVVARAAWAMGRGVEPLLAFSEGRTFRTALRLQRQPARAEEEQLGLMAYCHGCGDQQVQSLIKLRQWQPCSCPVPVPLSISGPLWIGPLQKPEFLAALHKTALHITALHKPDRESDGQFSPASLRLLGCLAADPGLPARCWPSAEVARRLQTGPPPLAALVLALQEQGYRAGVSGVMAGQLRSDAPWPVILQTASQCHRRAPATAK